MAYSEVLLVQPVDGLGGEGDQVKVRAGYARNFLIPQGKALEVTPASLRRINILKAKRAVQLQAQWLNLTHVVRKLKLFKQVNLQQLKQLLKK